MLPVHAIAVAIVAKPSKADSFLMPIMGPSFTVTDAPDGRLMRRRVIGPICVMAECLAPERPKGATSSKLVRGIGADLLKKNITD